VLLARFLDAPPPALHSALALWVSQADLTSPLVEWSATLPSQVGRGPIPSQARADAWADENTLGLIKNFPIVITGLTRLILASALATKVSWATPFELVPASEHLPSSSPWFGRVEQVLLDEVGSRNMVATTQCAGIVAVHFAQAVENLAVVSVSADPSVERSRVMEAAYDVVSLCRRGNLDSIRCSLFELPQGCGHSWNLSESEVRTHEQGEQKEKVASSVLPAWTITSLLDLKSSQVFGVDSALDSLLELIGPSPEGDVMEGMQAAVASYTPAGFEAAAISTMLLETRSVGPRNRGVQRSAALCFDHPFAAVAMSASELELGWVGAGQSETYCLPLFSAWVATPSEPRKAEPRKGDLADDRKWRIR
jgi:hypothetical protein